MSKLFTAYNLIKKNRAGFMSAILKNLNFLFPDKLYLQLQYLFKMGCKLDLQNPKSFNEKIQWLKLYNRNPLYTTLVDKYAVKKWVADRIGKDYVIPTLGVWDNAKDIDFNSLPERFVLKTTNGSGGNDVVVCKNKKKFNRGYVFARLNKSLKKNVYRDLREWPYKNIQPRIIAEKYMEDKNGELMDYKFFCFDGSVKCLQVDYDRFVEHHRNIYDLDWNLLPFSIKYPPKAGMLIEKPQHLDKMIAVAQELSKGFPHVRVDLYNVEGKIFFGELTFYHGSGFEKFNPDEWNMKFGEWLHLPNPKDA